MALPATDNFNRGDESPLAGNWTGLTGGDSYPKLVSNQAQGNGASSAARWNADSFNNDQYAKCTVKSRGTGWPGVAVRSSASTYTFYGFITNAVNTCQVIKCVGGSYTVLGDNYSVTVNLGTSVLKLSISGSTLTPNVDGVDLATRSDSAITSGSAGICFYGDATLDDWEGGNVTSGPTYTLLVDKGAFAETGKTLNLVVARKMPVTVGAFTETGNTVSWLLTRMLAAAVGNFAETGSAAGLTAARELRVNVGTFAETGNAVGLITARKLPVQVGTFAEVGNAVLLQTARKLACATGVFTLTGYTVSLIYTPVGAYILVANTGAFSEVGNAISFKWNHALACAVGQFTLTGVAAFLQYTIAPPTEGGGERYAYLPRIMIIPFPRTFGRPGKYTGPSRGVRGWVKRLR